MVIRAGRAEEAGTAAVGSRHCPQRAQVRQARGQAPRGVLGGNAESDSGMAQVTIPRPWICCSCGRVQLEGTVAAAQAAFDSQCTTTRLLMENILHRNVMPAQRSPHPLTWRWQDENANRLIAMLEEQHIYHTACAHAAGDVLTHLRGCDSARCRCHPHTADWSAWVRTPPPRQRRTPPTQPARPCPQPTRIHAAQRRTRL